MTLDRSERTTAMREFEAVTKPLIKWLNEHHNPHTRIIVSNTGAELLSDEMAYHTLEYIKD